MQKTTRIALAAMALLGSGAVLAQSSVTLYGRVNTTVEHQKNGATSVNGMFNNSSRIGFVGTEDLGGGLKAGFHLEAGFGSDDGSGPLNFSRQSEVNLSGNFGMVRLGNFTPESYYATADYISMHNHDTGSSADALYFDPAWTPLQRAAVPNKIGYRTPDFGGLRIDAAYGFGEKQDYLDTAGIEQKGSIDLAANYNNGPLGFGAGYSRQTINVTGSGDVKGQQLALRASYALGDLVLGGYYQYAKIDGNFFAGNAKRHAYRLAAMYTMGASEFHANVGRANNIKVTGLGGTDTAATQWTLAYNYNLSKRTKVYTYYTKINNGNNLNYHTQTFGNGDNFSSFALGIRHNF